MPAFCRHNRLIQNCPICSREQGTTMNPVVSSSAPRVSEPRERSAPRPASPRLGDAPAVAPRSGRGGRAGSGLKVRKLERGVEDGYVSTLVQGLKSSADAKRLADELAFAATRIRRLAQAPPATFALLLDTGRDLEERTWWAVQWALDPQAEPVSWSSGAGAAGYRAWAERAGSQEAAFTGEAYWTPERRFERVFERLGTVGLLDREPRYDLLVVLGSLGLYPLAAAKLLPGGENEVTWAAKRAFGIADPLLIERRAADLADACALPLAALDLGLHNWGVGSARRTGRGVDPDLEPDPDVVTSARDALGV